MSALAMTDDELRALADRLMLRDAHLLLWGHQPVGSGDDCEECGQPWRRPSPSEESPDQPPAADDHPAAETDH